jgi:hypothetical protein
MTVGSQITVSVTAANKVAMVLFDGVVNQRISLKMSSVSITGGQLYIYNPDGSTLASYGINTGGGFIDTKALPATGTYTIFIDPTGAYTGNITLTLYEVPPDLQGTITPGGEPVTVSIGTPGQNAGITFTGTANQRVSLRMSSVTITGGQLHIYNPDGSTLASYGINTGGGFIDTKALPATGTYTIFINPTGAYTGSITLTLYEVPPDLQGTITPGGEPVTVSLGTPGQDARLTFSGTTNQRISLKLSSVSITGGQLYIYNPDGSTLASSGINSGGGFIDTKALPATGTFTIFINPTGAYTGSITLTLYEVPPDVQGSIVINDPATPITLATPGQNAQLTFDGTASQQVTVRITNNAMSTVTVKLLKPDGSTLTSSTSASANFNLDMQTLPTTGLYTIRIDPGWANTGSMNVRATSP